MFLYGLFEDELISFKQDFHARTSNTHDMRVLASLNGRLKQVVNMVSPAVAELVTLVADTPSSATSMKKLAIRLATMLQKDHDEKFSEDDSEFVPTYRWVVQEIADWAAAGGDWQSREDFGDMVAWSGAWHNSLKHRQGQGYEEEDLPEMDFPDGWRIVQLVPENAEAEGSKMGHCIGTYKDRIEKGEVVAYSLRDPKNEPHVTFNVTKVSYPSPDGKKYQWDQIQGKEDSPPVDRYRPYISSFAETLNEWVEEPGSSIKARMLPSEQLLEMARRGTIHRALAFENMADEQRAAMAADFLSIKDLNSALSEQDATMANRIVRYIAGGGWRHFPPEVAKDVILSRVGKNSVVNGWHFNISEIPGVAEEIMKGLEEGDTESAMIALRSDLKAIPNVDQVGVRILGKNLLEGNFNDFSKYHIKKTYLICLKDLIQKGFSLEDEDLRTLDTLLDKFDEDETAVLSFGITEILSEAKRISPEEEYPRILSTLSEKNVNRINPSRMMALYEPVAQPHLPYGGDSGYYQPQEFYENALRGDVQQAREKHPPAPPIGPTPSGPRQMLMFGPQEIMRTAMLAEELGLPEYADRLEGMI